MENMKSKEIYNKIAELLTNRKKPIKNTVQLGRLLGLNAKYIKPHNQIKYCLRKGRRKFEEILREEFHIKHIYSVSYTLKDTDETFEECQLYCIAEGIPVLYWIDNCWRPLTSFIEHLYIYFLRLLISIKPIEKSIRRISIFGDKYIDERGEKISFKKEIIKLNSLIKDLKPYTTMKKEEMYKNDEQIISIWRKLENITNNVGRKIKSLNLDMEIQDLIKEDD